MKFGFVLPWGDARTAANLAFEAEKAGWDGFFVWEPVWGIDAWVSLTAAAMRTEKIKLGTMLSPISRMRPWKLASETATLDNLSNGRVILSVGLGANDTGLIPLEKSPTVRPKRNCWTKVWTSFMDFGVDNPSTTRANIIESKKPLFRRPLPRSKNHVFRFGLSAPGLLRNQCSGRCATMGFCPIFSKTAPFA